MPLLMCPSPLQNLVPAVMAILSVVQEGAKLAFVPMAPPVCRQTDEAWVSVTTMDERSAY